MRTERTTRVLCTKDTESKVGRQREGDRDEDELCYLLTAERRIRFRH